MHDLIILGAGPAGMTAGIYAARKQLDTLIITKDIGGQTNWTSKVENYMGYTPMNVPELMDKFEEHLRYDNVKMEFADVKQIVKIEGGFGIEADALRDCEARSIVIATGKTPRMLDVPGEREFIGKGVAYCATCDAPLFSGMDVAVVGGGNAGVDAAIQLMKIASKVYLIEMSSGLRADEALRDKVSKASNVEIMLETRTIEVLGDNMMTGLTVENISTGEKRHLSARGVLVEIGLVPSTKFLDGIIKLNERGEIPINFAAETEVPGIFAAGDATNVPAKQIIIAAGEGAKAALGAYSYLVRLPQASS